MKPKVLRVNESRLSMTKPYPQALLAPFGWEQRFEVLEKIGAGAMGQVWRARETATDRIVALKMIDPARCGDEQILARLEIEGETLTKLRDAGSHDHVVPILDFQVTDSHACLVMEFIPGLNLKKWCSTHQISLIDRVRLISQVARASGWFHDLGIVHRDLKPANILVSAVTHQPVIVDFSIAKVEDTLTLTLTNEALGTAPYMAPEQFDKKRGPISPASDVFALGATLYELLTQVHPHPGDFPQIMQRLVDEVRPAPPSALNPAVPKDLESIILKALSHRPTDRYVDGSMLADDLDRFLTGEPVTARPISTAAFVTRQAMRRPALTTAIAACLILLIAVAYTTRRAAHQRHQHMLESRFTQLLQDKSWTREQMQEAETALGALAVHDRARAAQLDRALIDDVGADIAIALQQPRLAPGDADWMQDAIAALQLRQPDEAARLTSLLQERQLRWETLVDLRAPFANREGLFPRGRQTVQGELLFPDYDDSVGISPSVLVKERFPTPVEISTTLVSTIPFRHVGFTFKLQTLRMEVGLYAVAHAPLAAFTLAGDLQRDTPGGILYLMKQGEMLSALHIPEPLVFEQPFHVILRADRSGLEVEVNQRWKLATDPAFTFVNTSTDNDFRISWPRTLGIRDLVIRAQQAGKPSPLEQGDLHAVAGEWARAQASYEQHVGHPQTGSESLYKLGIALEKQGKEPAAAEVWTRLAEGSSGLWHDLGLYQLWRSAVFSQSIADAKPYLDRLPAPGRISPEIPRAVTSSDRSKLAKAYSRVSAGLNFLYVKIEDMDQAMKAFAILGVTDLEIAYNLAGGYHMAGSDGIARELANRGLAFPSKASLDADSRSKAIALLDQWCRMDQSEREPKLGHLLKEWEQAQPQDASFTALSRIEQARVHARSGRLVEALPLLQSLPALKGVEPRLITNARLLEGAVLHELRRPDEALTAWLAGIQSAGDSAKKNPLQLYDRIMMHHATRSWTPEVCDEVISRLLGKGTDGLARLSLQSLFLKAFTSDPVYANSLNAFCHEEEGTRYVQDYAYARLPARELFRLWFSRMLERFILATSFPPHASQEDRIRVRATVQQTLAWITSTGGSAEVLSGFLHTWSSPMNAASFEVPKGQAPPQLVIHLKWLLAQRSRHLDAP